MRRAQPLGRPGPFIVRRSPPVPGKAGGGVGRGDCGRSQAHYPKAPASAPVRPRRLVLPQRSPGLRGLWHHGSVQGLRRAGGTLCSASAHHAPQGPPTALG